MEANQMLGFLKQIPLIGSFSTRLQAKIARRYIPFTNSEKYWLTRYEAGGTSGSGSYNHLAQFKATILNDFVSQEGVKTIIEYGCGDGNQLKLATYPSYLGFDISPEAIAHCVRLFKDDPTKRFALIPKYQGEAAELTLSLDVIFHLVEDEIYLPYMARLFDSAQRFVVIYSSNKDEYDATVPHVRHRQFTAWVEEFRPMWQLVRHIPNQYPFMGDDTQGSFADFYIFQKKQNF
jgi:SAM-dependent methyltransferase